LPEKLKDFVDDQVKRGYGTSSGYVRELIRKDQERLRLRELLLACAASPPTAAPGQSETAGGAETAEKANDAAYGEATRQ
jgi:antitoxin ParD1/3/4